MTVTRLAPGDYTTSRWSGGTTTELLIRPRGALYAQRDFLCRLFTAMYPELPMPTQTPKKKQKGETP